jgi:hypothetical protein
MIATKLIAAMIAAGLTITGAVSLLNDVTPTASANTGSASLRSVLTNQQALIALGYSEPDALAQAIKETPTWVGSTLPDGSLRIEIDGIATCGRLVDGLPAVDPCSGELTLEPYTIP